MTLGEIKIEALKLMFAGSGRDITVEDLDTMQDEEDYRDYLLGMTGAINRCLADIEEKRVLPLCSRMLPAEDGEAAGAFMRFDLSALIEDFFDIDRLTYLRGGTYDGDVPYCREGNVIMICDFEEDAEYRVLYRPTVGRMTAYAPHSTDIGVPDSIAVYIPHYIKGDLFRVDEPNEAGEARNWYEAALSEIAASEKRKDGVTRHVREVYSFSEV